MTLKVSDNGIDSVNAFILAFTICPLASVNMYLNAAVVMILTLVDIFLFKNKKLQFGRMHMMMAAWALMWLVSSFFSRSIQDGIKFSMFFMVMVAVSMNMNRNTYRKILRFLLIFSTVHVFFVILQAFMPQVVRSVRMILISAEHNAVADNLYWRAGAFSGITGQTGMTAFYCTVFLAAAITKSKNQKQWYFALIPGFIALLLTQKRAFLLIDSVIVLVVILSRLKHESSKKFIGACVLLAAVCGAGMAILQKFDITKTINKFLSGSLSSRDMLWAGMMEMFTSRPLFGWGLFSTSELIGNAGHNIYLQILSENGLVGAVVFSFLIIYVLNAILHLRGSSEELNQSRIFILFLLLYGISGNPIYDYQEVTLFIMSISMLQLSVDSAKMNRKGISSNETEVWRS